MDNQHAPPENESVAFPKIRFYSPGQITWASFLCFPIGGCLLLALNYRRLGDSTAANRVLLGGLIVTVLIFAVAPVLPDDMDTPSGPTILVAIVSVCSMYHCAQTLQGKAYENWLANGGIKGSGWVATGAGILGWILICAILAPICAVALALDLLGVEVPDWLGGELP